ncbi:hypothetical protein FH972_023389 [Carpinus fangiana]|uniref:Nephrocystin 3-like N-terminal domain-containing protein n=1 Tax=Carpinus fangiana TaxID=176857 RepID=A0A5N6KXC0_9ROSI|nr:hypothetical protein FH972_023389 [Carpinus fangiana]
MGAEAEEEHEGRDILMDSLSDDAFRVTFDFIRCPAPDTAQWIFEHSTFKKWQEHSATPILFLNGAPGTGKSVLSKQVFQTLDLQIAPGARQKLKAFFSFNSVGLDIETTLVGMLRSLVHQLLTQASSSAVSPKNIPDMILSLNRNKDKYREEKMSGTKLLIQVLSDTLRREGLFKDYDVCLVIDSLDEAQPEDLHAIVDVFDDWTSTGSRKLFISGQSSSLFESAAGASVHHFLSMHETLFLDDTSDDTTGHLVTQGDVMKWIKHSTTIRKHNGKSDLTVFTFHTQLQELEKKSPSLVSNFLWVDLARELLTRSTPPFDGKLTLDTLPSTTDALYEKFQPNRFPVLHLLASLRGSCSLRHLRDLYALSLEGTQFQRKEAIDRSHGFIKFNASQLGECSSMIQYEDDYDKVENGTSIVRLRNASLMAFLDRNIDKAHDSQPSGTYQVARAYLKYLILDPPGSAPADEDEQQSQFKMNSIVARWPYFANAALSMFESTSLNYKRLSRLVESLHEGSTRNLLSVLPSTYLELMPQDGHDDVDLKQTSLLCQAGEGRCALAELLIDHGADVNALFPNNSAPQISALCHADHIIALLLRRTGEEGFNKLEKHFLRFRPTTPLGAAVISNSKNASLVSLLLSSGADPNALSNGVSPLHDALSVMPTRTFYTTSEEEKLFNIRAHVKIVKALVDHGADINFSSSNPTVSGPGAAHGQRRSDSHTTVRSGDERHAQAPPCEPLLVAVEKGWLPVVELFVDAGAELTHDDNGVAPALHAAAVRGHSDIQRQPTPGSSALAAAAKACERDTHVDVVRALLAHARDTPGAAGYSIAELEAAEKQAAQCGGRNQAVELIFDARMRAEGVDERSARGMTMLQTAAGRKILEMVKAGRMDPGTMTTAMRVRYTKALMAEAKERKLEKEWRKMELVRPNERSRL